MCCGDFVVMIEVHCTVRWRSFGGTFSRGLPLSGAPELLQHAAVAVTDV